ncbi:MAG: DUF2510 domain-containing protein [Aeromicrobium sp.]
MTTPVVGGHSVERLAPGLGPHHHAGRRRRLRSIPAGWYPQGAIQRYRDGMQWTEHTAPLPPGT